MLTLPESLFSNPAYAKTIFVLRKQEEESVQPFVYPFTDLQDQDQVAVSYTHLDVYKRQT